MRCAFFLASVVVIVLLLPATSVAAPSVKALFKEGNRRYEKKDYTGALARFHQAHGIKKDPRILLNIALTKEKLHRLPEAAVDYERFLLTAAGGRYPKRARAVRGLLQKLREKVASVTIVCPLGGASVSAGGVARGQTPLPYAVYLEPGTHSLEVSKKGYLSFQQKLTLTAGQHRQLKAPLEKKRPPPEKKVAAQKKVLKPLPAAPVPPPNPPSRPFYKRWWFWTAVGAVVAGSTAAVIATQTGGGDRLPGGELGRYPLD